MTLPFRAAVIGLLALSLAACAAATPTSTGSIGAATPPASAQTATDKAKATFDAACKYEPAAYQAYWIASVFVKVSDKTAATVDAAHLIVADLCARPPEFADAGGWADAARRVVNAVATVKAARDATKEV